jgi:hypothetical protein
MLVRGGRGGGDAQFAETDGELVGDGVGVLEYDVEGVTDDEPEGVLVYDAVADGIELCDIVVDNDGDKYAPCKDLIELADADALELAVAVADADALELAVADADALEVAVADALAEDVRVGVGTKGRQQNVKSVAIEFVMNAQPYDTDATAHPTPFIPVVKGSCEFSQSE